MAATSTVVSQAAKKPVYASQAVAACNHPIASSVAVNMLASGGSVADAGVAAAFTLSVVEPMMVGPPGSRLHHLPRRGWAVPGHRQLRHGAGAGERDHVRA